MYEIKYDFLFCLLTYTLSFAALVLFCILTVKCLIDIFKKREIKNKIIKFFLIFVCVTGMILSLPFWFAGMSFSVAKTNEEIESYSKLAVKTAILPSVKSYMYYELGNVYQVFFEDGKKAIENYEKSKEPYTCVNLCTLYIYKRDYDNALKNCSDAKLYQLTAINYILQNDYKQALNSIDKKLQNPKNANCTDYAVRGYIYRKAGQSVLSDKDFDKALKMCPKSEKIKNIYSNENYFDELYTKKRKEYKL